jgi:hypothetical protein
VKLAISRAESQPGNYLVVVNGDGFYNAVGRTVGTRICGDDEWFDDKLFSIGVGGTSRVLHDGSFSLSKAVPSGWLNEDWGEDEIYALVDMEGHGSFKSNTVRGYF